MILSIIVPVYNVEKYLELCVTSLVNQKLSSDDYEIILVNDGSTDNSRSIAEKLAEKYSNIVLINQENQGPSGARNTGITQAKGEYVWCIDSDDEIDGNLDEIVREIKEIGNLDFYGIILKEVDKDKNLLKYSCDQSSVAHEKVMTGSNAIISGYNPSSACAFFMRKKFLMENNLTFKAGLTHEDVEFTYRAMAVAKRVYFSKHANYYYYRWGNTRSTAKDRERLLKYILDDIEVAKSFNSLADSVTEKELSRVISNRSRNIIFGLVFSLFRNRKEWGAMDIVDVVIEKLISSGFYPMPMNFDTVKKNIATLFLNRKYILKL
jgi:glycosyltransferase involved in cell wall biosynthesis